MGRGQRLDTGDPGDNFIVELKALLNANGFEDTKDAVIETRVAPDEEGAPLALGELLRQQALIALLDIVMPGFDTFEICRLRLVSRRDVEIDHSVVRFGDEAVANLATQPREIPLLATLVRDEEHAHLIESIDGLERNEFEGAGTGANDEDFALHVLSATGGEFARRQRFQFGSV